MMNRSERNLGKFSIESKARPWTRVLGAVGSFALILGTGACGANDPQTSSSDSNLPGDAASELSLGATGPEVLALHEYFSQYGYFPNNSLQQKYAAWRPIVPSAPADNATFDASTEAATRAFQRNAGLPETGIVDAATRSALSQPRCEVPDGIEPHDSSEKWDLSNTGTWNHSNLTWKLSNTYTTSTNPAVQAAARAQVEGVIGTVLGEWDTRSGYTFAKTTGTPDILISFSSSLASNVNASTTAISNGGDVTMNINRTWSIGVTPVGSGAMDMASILIHELGHAVGLAHTPNGNAIMYPFFNNGQAPKTTPTTDDTTSILAMQSAFTLFDSGDNDIAYNRQPNNDEQIWVTGGGTTGGGYNIWDLRNKTTWTQHPGGALRIAVNPTLANAAPWIVNDQNELFNYAPSTDGWDIVTGVCATDVGVGEDNSVWIIGCSTVGGGHDIRKLTGGRFSSSGDGAYICFGPCFTTFDGGGVRIAVGPYSYANPTNVPWVTNDANSIFRREDATTTGAAFNILPGTATDIAAAGGIAWSIAPNGGIQVWDEQQNGGVGGGPPPVTQRKWVTVPGAGTNISVAAGRPVVVNSAGNAHWTEPN
jgi:peptidoglycan hydrolase-like protein with peptidoglycan-binding domain